MKIQSWINIRDALTASVAMVAKSKPSVVWH
jgi:hypothetical protein